MRLDDFKDRKWVSVPLKQCLLSVCSSCPDQLMNSNTAIYSANFQESKTVENWSPLHDSRSNIIWEGHGLLSNILSSDHSNSQSQVTGKITSDSQLTPNHYDCSIEVLIQLHPIRHSPLQNHLDHVPQQQYLPPMRSIWNESMSSNYSSSPPPPLPHNNHINNTMIPNNVYRHLLQRHNERFRQKTIQVIRQPLNKKWSREEDSPVASRVLLRQLWKSKPINNKTSPGHVQHTTLVSTATDTYYHQSRRKKRDTKPPNANDIRPFVEVERSKDGDYVLPAEVDSWTVLSLGAVVWDRAAFHNQRYIYPVGYRVKKWYRSMVDPHSDTQYTCEILDGGDEPIFQLNADDNPSECWRGPTPTTVWTIAVRRAFAIRNMDYGHNPVGPDFFGLRKNTIAKMIQDLANADKCKNYIWQNFEAMSNSKGKSVRRSTTRLSYSSSAGSSSQHVPAVDDRSSGSPTPAIKIESVV
ncbi:F/Y-rich N-terminus-domain-containing protein [Helicostylum pulchrum]|nr:F/Y-rich N-terminus-domain-containing protein [Helicostylum pulchrum]